jgi:hypothetical protein
MGEIIKNAKKLIIRSLTNTVGLILNEKIIVLKSNNWESTSMSSKEAFNNLLNKNYPAYECP